METVLYYLASLAEIIAHPLVAILTVVVMSGIKRIIQWVDALAPSLQQIIVVLLAYVFTQAGAWLTLPLPADLALFTEADVSSLLNAAMAYGIHAGKRAKDAAEL